MIEVPYLVSSLAEKAGKTRHQANVTLALSEDEAVGRIASELMRGDYRLIDVLAVPLGEKIMRDIAAYANALPRAALDGASHEPS